MNNNKDNDILKKDLDYSPEDNNMFPYPYDKFIKLIGLDNYQKLISEFGGRNIYIPKEGAIERIIVNDKIKKEFTGKNARELSNKYGVNIRTVYDILKQIKN